LIDLLPNRVRLILAILLGLLAGAGLGLYLGWVAWPTEFTQADPVILEDKYRRDYALMIATAYALDGDLATARRRLANLDEQDGNAWLLTVTVDAILAQADVADIERLVQLSTDLGLYSPVMAPYRQPAPVE
jgi:hypothetical protein